MISGKGLFHCGLKSYFGLLKLPRLLFMTHYDFVTFWEFEAPLERVWKEIRDLDAWPAWWPYVKSVSMVRQGNAEDIGSVRRIVWTTALPYKISFDTELIAIEHLQRIEGKATGDLTGIGIWTFRKEDQNTLVRYDWSVRTTSKWMNLLAPIARPLFKWNHDKVMAGGYSGLKKRLESAPTT